VRILNYADDIAALLAPNQSKELNRALLHMLATESSFSS